MSAVQLGLPGRWEPVPDDPDPSDRLTRPMRDALALLAVAGSAHAEVVVVDASPTRWHRTAVGRAILDVHRSTWSALERRGLVEQLPAGVVRLTPDGQDRVAATTGRAVRQGLQRGR